MKIDKIKFFLKVLLGKEVYYSNQIKCDTLTLGNDYGSWIVCPKLLDKHSIVYSFGIGEDISWDLGIIEKFGCEVYAFDPSPKSISFIEAQFLPKKLTVQYCGISSNDGELLLYPPENSDHVSYSINPISGRTPIKFPVKKLSSIMKEYGHTKIDILKMDVEGAEYDVIENFLHEKINVKQILIEFHHRFVGIGKQKTIDAVNLLNKHKYKIFAISESGLEYSFIRIS